MSRRHASFAGGGDQSSFKKQLIADFDRAYGTNGGGISPSQMLG
jgi:hypothetical protein